MRCYSSTLRTLWALFTSALSLIPKIDTTMDSKGQLSHAQGLYLFLERGYVSWNARQTRLCWPPYSPNTVDILTYTHKASFAKCSDEGSGGGGPILKASRATHTCRVSDHGHLDVCANTLDVVFLGNIRRKGTHYRCASLRPSALGTKSMQR